MKKLLIRLLFGQYTRFLISTSIRSRIRELKKMKPSTFLDQIDLEKEIIEYELLKHDFE